MEALLNGKGDNYSYISSTITVFAVTDQATTVTTFQMDGFLQQFHLVIKYKKGIHNKVADMLSRPVINASTMLRYNPLAHESYVEQYAKDDDFKDVYDALTRGNQQSDYYVHDNLLYHLGKICIPRDERVNVIREAHTSLISGHFGVGKTIAQLQRYFYWPQMNRQFPSISKGVLCVPQVSLATKIWVYIHHFQYLLSHGKVSPWIL
jgi:hypothetical protein